MGRRKYFSGDSEAGGQRGESESGVLEFTAWRFLSTPASNNPIKRADYRYSGVGGPVSRFPALEHEDPEQGSLSKNMYYYQFVILLACLML
jgi:hypothetical protein